MKKPNRLKVWSSAAALLTCTSTAIPGVAEAGDFLSTLSNDGKGYDLSDSILGEDAPIDFGGWTQFGVTSASDGLFNNQEDSVRNQQTWLYFEKGLDASEGFDYGFRVDAMYGADAADTQAFGSNPGNWDFDDYFNHGDDGFAVPQAYIELGYKDFSIKGGHFYTLAGYEYVTAPDNFFYSHAFTMYKSEPFTHTGAYITYSGIENVTLYGGWTAGWDTGFDQNNGGSNFLGGFSVTPLEQVTATYITTIGNLGAIGDGYSHSIVIDTSITDSLNYVFQTDYLNTNADVLGSGQDYETVGINNYLLYTINDIFGVGLRGEWWHADDENYGGLTGGVNIKPLPNLTLRPEIRYQWGPDGADNTAGLPSLGGPAIVGMDAIITF